MLVFLRPVAKMLTKIRKDHNDETLIPLNSIETFRPSDAARFEVIYLSMPPGSRSSITFVYVQDYIENV